MTTKPQIVILEDDPDVGGLLRNSLCHDDLDVHLAPDCAGFERIRAALDPDLLIIDLGLPDGDGLEVARRSRTETDAGIIIVTARSDEIDAVLSLESCADDYVTKPFRVRELRARVRSVLRRTAREKMGPGASPEPWEIGTCRFDPVARRVTDLDGLVLPLTRSEFEVLAALLQHRGEVLSRDQIVSRVRGEGWAVNDRLIDGIVSRIRTKFASSGCKAAIRTVRGIGYVIDRD